MSHANFNKLEKHYWIWPIAWDLFLGALGGGILVLVAVLDIVFGGQSLVGIGSYADAGSLQVGAVFACATLTAVVALALASAMLVFELGQPKVFYRVFLSGTAVIKYGAAAITLSIVFGFVYCVCNLPLDFNPLYNAVPLLSQICCYCMLICGLSVMIYTGVLLASMKSKPFWNTPVLPVLFIVSGCAMAASFLAMTAGLWPGLEIETTSITVLQGMLQGIAAICTAVTIIVLMSYLLLQLGAGSATARKVSLRWLKGSFAPAFWGGVLLLGLVLPFILLLVGGFAATYLAPVLLIAAGLLMRFLIVYSDDRRAIPGEERYWARMPSPNAGFLSAQKK